MLMRLVILGGLIPTSTLALSSLRWHQKHRQQNQNPQVGAHQTEKFLEQPAEEKGKLPSEVFTNCKSHKGLVLKT